MNARSNLIEIAETVIAAAELLG